MKQKVFTQKIQSAQERITGRVFCHSGQHFVASESIVRRAPRPICSACAEFVEQVRMKRKEAL